MDDLPDHASTPQSVADVAPSTSVPTGSNTPTPVSAVLVLLLYFALQIAVALAWTLLQRNVGTHIPALATALHSPSLMLSMVLLLAALPVLALVRLHWRSLWSVGALPGLGVRWPGWRWLLGGLLLAALLLPLVMGVNALLFPRQGVTQSVLVVFDQAHLLMRVLLTAQIVLLAPFVEELLFRGLLLAGLAQRMRLRLAVSLSVALFALAHLPDTSGHWQVLPGLLLLALGLTWLRLRSGSLLPGWAAHALYNASVLSLALAPLLRR